MKTLSILAFLLALGILGCSIYGGQYHNLPLAMMSGILGWAMWPEKKQDFGKSLRNNKTWKE
jgi:hypothetical protein